MDKEKERSARSHTELNPEIHRRLEAAVLNIFSEQDFHRASMRAVAKKAGVSFGTIYNYYGSKEQLLFAFLDDWLRQLSERLIDHLQGMEDLKEKVRKVFWVQLDFYERNPGVRRILYLTVPWITWMSDETFKQKKMYDLFLGVIRRGQQEGILNPDVRAGALIDLVQGMVHRCCIMWIYRGENEKLTDKTNVFFEMLWRGMTNPNPRTEMISPATHDDTKTIPQNLI